MAHGYKRIFSLFFTAMGLAAGSGQAWAQSNFAQKLTNESNVWMTIANNGLLGNAFRGVYVTNNWPSAQFPRRSNIEHLFQGGLWVGAKRGSSQVTRVATGGFDASAGYSPGAANFEFYAAPNSRFIERSNLPNKGPLYNPNAVSHQDFLSTFVDTFRVVPGTQRLQQANDPNPTPYDPLGIKVDFETYNWNFSFANFFVVLNYRITNISSERLDSIYVGLWSDPVVRNVAIVTPGGTPFFATGGSGFMDTLMASYEYQAGGSGAIDTNATRSYFATKFLGGEDPAGTRNVPWLSQLPLNNSFRINYNTWNFNSPSPVYFRPDTENERFLKLRDGMNRRSDWPQRQEELKQPFNRSMLISTGPWTSLDPGQSLTVTFAVVCAKQANDGRPIWADTERQRINLIRNLSWVQTAYAGNDKDYDGIADDGSGSVRRFILPSPPNIPVTKVVPRNNAVDIYWNRTAETSIDPISKEQDFEGYRIYKSRLGYDVSDRPDLDSAMQLLAEFDIAGNNRFFDVGFNAIKLPEPVRFDGDTATYHYKYTVNNIQNGWQQVFAVTAFDRGDSVNNLQPLETSLTTNLYRVFPGTQANADLEKTAPYAYPNPYYGDAAWEGATRNQESRKLVFANLPRRCTVRIFSASGDLIDEFNHDQGYNGSDIRWFRTYSETSQNVFSGGEHAWDLLSRNQQIIARGLYLFSVEDLDSGKTHKGQFVVIK